MMSEAKFTKGKWRIYTHKGSINSYIDVENGEGEILCSFDFCKRAEQRKVADANLIAAAPEMYKFLDDLANGRGTDYPIEKLLAKARGENEL